MELFVRRLSDNKIFPVSKYIQASQEDDNRQHIWCNEWNGHHIIGNDCEFEEREMIAYFILKKAKEFNVSVDNLIMGIMQGELCIWNYLSGRKQGEQFKKIN